MRKNDNTSTTSRQIPGELQEKTFLDPRYNPAFHAFFNSEDALVSFLNGVLHLDGCNQIESLVFKSEDPLQFRVPEWISYGYL
ncbi:MAG: hypothetical protein M0P13_08885 [Fibrobacteraceae bacterium]|nr:hypothetical protein [Fibrobacteraceae bacterium]